MPCSYGPFRRSLEGGTYPAGRRAAGPPAPVLTGRRADLGSAQPLLPAPLAGV